MRKLTVSSQDMLHLDAVRFFAAAAIVFDHWQADFIPVPGVSFFSGNAQFCSLAVDLFFVISGIVMYQVYRQRLISLRNYGVFIQRRIARLYPLHLLTFSFMFMLGIGMRVLHLHAHHAEDYGFDGVLPNLFLVQAFPTVKHSSFNAPSWSISAEMGCYLLLPLFFVFYSRKWWAPALLGLIGITALTFWCHGLDWTTWTFWDGFLRAIPSFLIGITLGGASRVLRRIPFPSLLFPLFGASTIVLGSAGISRGVLLTLTYMTAVTAFACDVQGSQSRVIRTLAPLGQLTYSIYLIHGLVMPTFFNFVLRRLHLSPWINNSLILATFVPLVAISYFSYSYFEAPARRWVQSLGSKHLSQDVHEISSQVI